MVCVMDAVPLAEHAEGTRYVPGVFAAVRLGATVFVTTPVTVTTWPTDTALQAATEDRPIRMPSAVDSRLSHVCRVM